MATTETADTEATRKTATRFLDALTTGNSSGVIDLFEDGATWDLLGHTEEFGLYRSIPKDEIGHHLGVMGAAIATFHGMSVEPVMADGHRAAIEMHARGANAAGKQYDNRILMLLEIERDKIVAMREWVDTLHLKGIMEG